jgi:uncharacterized LabA/DUF88 family protein
VTEAALAHVSVFIDGVNLFLAAQRERQGGRVDYGRLLDTLLDGRRLHRATAYLAYDEDMDRQQRFLALMRRRGIRVVQTRPKRGRGGVQTDMAVAMATDMLAGSGDRDTVVLVCAEEGLAHALRALTAKGVRIEVADFAPREALVDVADRFVDLTERMDAIRMEAKEREPERVAGPEHPPLPFA